MRCREKVVEGGGESGLGKVKDTPSNRIRGYGAVSDNNRPQELVDVLTSGSRGSTHKRGGYARRPCGRRKMSVDSCQSRIAPESRPDSE